MAINKNTQTSGIDNSNLTAYPFGQVVDNDGSGDGFNLNRQTTSDIYEMLGKLMRLAGLTYNDQFDNETNGFQYVAALVALASKNDYKYTLASDGTTNLLAPTALAILQPNEMLWMQAGTNYASETTVKGTDGTSLTLTISAASRYNTNDWLILLKTTAGITIFRSVTAESITSVATQAGFLQAVSNANELIGTAVDAATTPASNLYAFTKRTTDPTDAIPFLASGTTPGLLSAANWLLITNFVNAVKNVGFLSGFDPGGETVGAFLTVSGNITQAEIAANNTGSGSISAYTEVTVTMQNAMANTNYFVRIHIESQGVYTSDIQIRPGLFRPISTTSFSFMMSEANAVTQTLKIHFEVVQY